MSLAAGGRAARGAAVPQATPGGASGGAAAASSDCGPVAPTPRSTLRKSGLSELHRARHVGRWQSVVRQVCIQPRALVKREWAPVGGMDEIQGADEIVRKNLAVEETICVDAGAAVCSQLKWRVWQLRQWHVRALPMSTLARWLLTITAQALQHQGLGPLKGN